VNLGTAQVIRANTRNLPLADDSVDLVVTSPPYFALRSYRDGGEHYAGQIGDEPTPAEFVDSLLEVTRECVRVLKPSGSLWVNLGDKYAQGEERSRNGNGNRVSIDGFTGGKPIRAEVGTVTLGRKDNGGVPRKSLIGIPWRYALRCIDDLGLILRAEVIWSKPNGLPESVTDRVRRSHEVWFHFTLEPRYFSAVDEIRERHETGPRYEQRATGRVIPGLPAQSNLGAGGSHLTEANYNPLGKLPGSVWTVPTEPLRVPDRLGVDHFAAFPTEWPRRIIQGWSPAGVCVECGEGRRPVVARERSLEPGRKAVGLGATHEGGRVGPQIGGPSEASSLHHLNTYAVTGYACACIAASCECPPCPGRGNDGHGLTHCAECCMGAAVDADLSCPRHGSPPPTTPAVVLDPFGGTGTTALVAKALGRHGISVDMSADYCRLAKWRSNDRDQLAKVLGVAKAEPVASDEQSLLDLLEGGAA